MSAFSPADFSVDNTYGATLLGALTATFLAGMNTLQMILYFRIFPEDPIIIKASVSVAWCLDIIHTAFVWVTLWTYLIVYIGQIGGIDQIVEPVLIPGTTAVTLIVTLIVHIFYTLRIFRISNRNYWISVPIVLLVLAHVGGQLATMIKMYEAKRFSVFAASQSRWILSLGLVFGTATDVAIMVAMFVLLTSSRQKSISLTNVIDKLILYTFEMGSTTAITAALSMITWFVDGHSLIFGAFYLCIEKVYVISFMALLNARYHLRYQTESQNNSQGWRMSRFAHATDTTSTQTKTTEIPLREVHVDVTQSVQYDNKASSGL